MIVGLTGGIGSGKSTVANFFKELGVPVYDSDDEAKRLMRESKEVREAIVNVLGSESYQGQKLNKTYISDIVFKDSQKLKELNDIVHPAVRNHFKEWTLLQNAPYVIQETALIFENNAQENYDAVILVIAPELTRIQRVVERDSVTEEQVRARMAHQLSDDEKKAKANFIVENIEIKKTRQQVEEIHETLLKRTMG